MKECRVVLPAKYECKKCPGVSEAGDIYFVSSPGIRRCYFEVYRACKTNNLLLSIPHMLPGKS